MNTDKKLTNKDIDEGFRDVDCYLSFGDFSSCLIANVIKMTEELENTPDLNKIYQECEISFKSRFDQGVFGVTRFTYESLNLFLTPQKLASMPSLFELNQVDEGILSLGALARNMFYDILRESITQPLD